MAETYRRFVDLLPGWIGQSLTAIITTVVAVGLALLFHRIFFRILLRISRASESPSDDLLVRKLARPTRYSLIALALALAAREIPALATIWDKLAGFVMPALIGWIALAVLHTLINAMEMHTDTSHPDNRDARRKRTRLAIFSRIASFLIIFVTIGLMLLSIPGVRDVGVTLMASAGLAGLAVGAAAQPALKSLIGGLQMALTEPINIDDVVIMDGEWGWIEDIRTTYVVVRIWDRRRLIVPMSKFLEETFENWTRVGAQIIAPVHLYLDPTTDVAPLRAHYEKLIDENPKWDRDVQNMQVIEATPEAMEVRMLMTAKDSPTAWELRCEIREQMLDWIRQNQPEALVRHRLAPVDTPAELAAAAAAMKK